jgi:hypothetical protein
MSSAVSRIAQIGRRINYFMCLADISSSTYNVTVNSDNNSWAASPLSPSTTPVRPATSANSTILQDMGEIAKVGGQLLRKVRIVNKNPAGGDGATFFIVMPGGEYPTQGVQPAGALSVAAVARLG